jgi:multidrug efflux pump subunit AcrB
MPLFCPRCQTRLDIIPDPSDRRVTCPSCQTVFTAAEARNDPPRAGVVPWYVVGLALLPLVIPAIAIPLHLLVGGLAGAAIWGAVGAGLAVVGLAVAWRRTWTRGARVLVTLGLAGLGFAVMLGALAASRFFGPEAARPLPTVTVEASFPGATAQVVADTVAAPIEQEVAGFPLPEMVDMRSQSRDDGTYTLTVTFQRAFDPNMAQVMVQNRLALGAPRLPELVNRRGISVKKKSPGALMIVSVFSPDGSRDARYLSNYATLHMRDELARLPGVGDVTVVGQRDSGARVWLDAEKLAAHGLTADDVVRAIEQQNLQVAAHQVPGGPPVLNAVGRLAGAEEFPDMALKAVPGGDTVRLRDVGEVEMGAGQPGGDVLLDGKPAVALVVHPTPLARPQELGTALREELERQRAKLPAGVGIDAAYDFTANLAAASWQATPGYLLLDVDLPPGASPERRLRVVERCAAVAREVPGVQGVLAMTEHPFDHRRDGACVLARLGTADREQLLRTLRTRLGDVQEANVRLRDLSAPGRCWDCRYPIELAVSGPDAGRVREFAGKLADRLRHDPSLTDLWAGSDAPAHRELTVTVDHAVLAGRRVALREVLNTLRAHLGQPAVGPFERFGRVWQMTVKTDPAADNRAEELKKLRVRDAEGQMVPLSDLIAVREVEAAAAVERLNLRPMVAITANPAPGVSLSQAQALCEARAEEVRRELGLPAEYGLTWP